MSLGEHLVELRKRLMWGAASIVLGAVAGWFLYEPVWSALYEPVRRIAEAQGADPTRFNLTYQTITGGFEQRLQVAIVVGIVISAPVWLFQIFAFLVPGLTTREKRYTFGFFFSAVPLFFAGCATGWFVLPHIVELMASFVPPESAALYEARAYLDFVLKLVLASGIAFVLPVFLVLLNFIGVLEGRAILAGWRWAILAITLFTAIATPAADVISMFLLAIPMIALYFAAVGIAVLHDRRAARRQEAVLRGDGDASLAAGA